MMTFFSEKIRPKLIELDAVPTMLELFNYYFAKRNDPVHLDMAFVVLGCLRQLAKTSTALFSVSHKYSQPATVLFLVN